MEAPGPSTTSTVSASGVEAIETTIDITPQIQISEVPLEDVYEVDRTVAEIQRGRWTKVCLHKVFKSNRMSQPANLTSAMQVCMQFPDELLHDSVPVFQAVRRRLPDNVELYVMADTTHGR